MIYASRPTLRNPRQEPQLSPVLERGLHCFLEAVDEACAEGVLLTNNTRLLVDLGYGSDLRSLGTSNPSRSIGLYESKYFVPLVAHPSLNPLIKEVFERKLRESGLMDREQLIRIIRPWYLCAPELNEGEKALGPVGCSALLFAQGEDGDISVLIGKRSEHCAISVGAWTTSIDECISNLTGWERGLVWDAIGDELGINYLSREKYLEYMEWCGWMVPTPIADQVTDDPWKKIVQSGANAVFTLEVSEQDLRSLHDSYKEGFGKDGNAPEFDEFAIVKMSEAIDYVMNRGDLITEVLYSTLKFLGKNKLKSQLR